MVGHGTTLVLFQKNFSMNCGKIECWKLKDVESSSPLHKLASMLEEKFDPEVWNYECAEHKTVFPIGAACPGGLVEFLAGTVAPVATNTAYLLIKSGAARLTSANEVLNSVIRDKFVVAK